MWCTPHLQNADATKLAKMGANKKTIEHIMGDIHGSQINTLECKGFADAVDLEDFQTKLNSLKEICDALLLGFNGWFEGTEGISL